MKERFREIFKQKTRDEWCAVFAGSDACFAPVLTMSEARRHPHLVARRTFVEAFGATQPAPAPRFGRSQCEIQSPPPRAGQHTDEVLREYGFSAEEIRKLRDLGAVA
jgi:alpha-methylacyl-CoA racemase